MKAAVKLKLSERNLEQYVIDLLLVDGWRVFRTDANRRHHDSGSVRHPLGEPGMADLMCCRYYDASYRDQAKFWNEWHMSPADAELLWIEMKSPTGRLAPHQAAWHTAERARGAMTVICGQDFQASPEAFLEWYRRSGLMRREIK